MNSLNNFEKYTHSPYYDLEDGLNTETDLTQLTVVFYFLNGVLSILNNPIFTFFRYAQNLKEEAQEYFDYICKIYASMINEYSYLAIFGELRYMREKIKEPAQIITDKFFNKTQTDRNFYKVYCKESYKYTKSSIEQIGRLLFTKFSWEESFGGPAWGKVVESLKYYGKVPDYVYIDYCVDIQHNTGSFLNKGCDIFSENMNKFLEVLDFKKYYDVLSFIEEYGNYFDKKSLKIAERFCNLIVKIENIAYDSISYCYNLGSRVERLKIKEKAKEFLYFQFKNKKSGEILCVLNVVRRYLYNKNKKLYKNNFNIFTLSMFVPHSFGEEDMAKYIKFVYPRYSVIKDEIEARDFITNPKNFPVFNSKLYSDDSIKQENHESRKEFLIYV